MAPKPRRTYARDLERVRVLPVYGGQPIDRQMARLRGGVQIIVGTPGRIVDHLRRETLSLEALKMVVLDEADEMLRMGFIEEVEWILAHAPGTFQTALFTATMPAEVRRLAARYLKDPVQVAIQPTPVTVPANRAVLPQRPGRREAAGVDAGVGIRDHPGGAHLRAHPARRHQPR